MRWRTLARSLTIALLFALPASAQTVFSRSAGTGDFIEYISTTAVRTGYWDLDSTTADPARRLGVGSCAEVAILLDRDISGADAVAQVGVYSCPSKTAAIGACTSVATVASEATVNQQIAGGFLGVTVAVDPTGGVTSRLQVMCNDTIGAAATGGGDAASFALCATGNTKGFGLDATTGKYAATCGNYNWSAESGGAADYNTATTAGGNGEYLTCTGVAAATSDLTGTYTNAAILTDACGAGSSTSVCKVLTTSIPANTYRDRNLRVSIGGTVNWRTIVSDVDNGADHDFTVTPDRLFTGDPSGLVVSFWDSISTVCHNAGERIKLNYMADAMLAQDHTVPGGKVYFPNFAGYDHAIYVDRGCGRKGTVAVGTSGNNCPLLAPPLNSYFQRSLQAFQRINWVSQGTDPDGYDNGRKNVWHIDDLGGSAVSGNRGYDPNDGTTINHNWTFKSGLASVLGRGCTPTSATDPTCDPTASQSAEVGDSAWGRVFNMAHTVQTTDPTALCVDNTRSTSGTCRGDRRIFCDATGARISTTTGGCDFGAGGDLGPCESTRDAIEYEVETLGKELKILAYWNLYEFPETTVQQITETADVFTVQDVPGTVGAPTACGTGDATISVVNPVDNLGGGWPFGKSKLEATDNNKQFVVVDWERWYNEGGGWTNGTFSPNTWYGRDIDGGGTSNFGDCLSGGTPASNDDEPWCEFNALMALHSSYSGGFQNIVVTNGSSSSVDGSVAGMNVKLYDSLIINGKRGVLADASNWDIQNDTWLNNVCHNSCFNANFTHSSIISGQRFIGNAGATIFGTNHGKGMIAKDFFFQGNRGPLIALNHASDTTFENIIAYGNTATFMVIYPQFPLNNLTVKGVHAYGRGNEGGGSSYGASLINFIRLGNSFSYNEPVRNFVFEDIHFESPTNNACLFYFDDAQETNGSCIGLDDPYDCCTGAGAGACPNTTISENRTQFSITDSSIDALNGATGQRAICTVPIGATGGIQNGIGNPTSVNDEGIWTRRWLPTWRNVRANGVPIPDQPYPSMTAAQASTCGVAIPLGAVVRISDDTTGIGTCDDAAVAGTLTGGGAFSSVCKCVAGPNWNPL